MKLGADDTVWHWLTPDRQDRSGGKWDLVTHLSNGSLPPETLVWHKGWGEWLPASKVAELANALPTGSAETAVVPSEAKDSQLVPPKPSPSAAEAPRAAEAAPAKPAAAAMTAGFAPVGSAARTTVNKFTRPQISPPRIVLPSERNVRLPEPDPPPSSFGVLGAPKQRPPAVAAPPLIAQRGSPFLAERGTHPYEGARPPMPTLSDEAPPPTATLRPPAAVPPPPRGTATAGPVLDPAVLARFARLGRAEDTPLPLQRAAPTGPGETKDVDEIEVELTLDEAVPTLPRDEHAAQGAASAAALTERDRTAPTMIGHRPPSEPAPATIQTSPKLAETKPPEAAGPAAPAPSAPPPGPTRVPFSSTLSSEHRESVRLALGTAGEGSELAAHRPQAPARDATLRRLQLTVYVLGGIASLLGLMAVGLLIARRSSSGAPSETPSASASARPVLAPTRCQVVAHPARLAATIDRTVPPLLATPSDGRAVLGFAETSKRAVGLMVAAQTLDSERVFEKPVDRPLKSVVPLLSSGAPTFALDADGGALKNARTIDAKLPFSIGLGEGGVARVISSTAELIWPLSSSAITEPRVATLPDGYLVTFRDGGLEGKIMIGWLGPDGGKRSELVALPGPQFVGTPFAAAANRAWLLAFAGRASSQDPWRVELLQGEQGKTEARRTTFEAPAGGLGGGQIAPSVAAMQRGYWLLQWTEGKSGMYQVRTQLLGPDLKLVGEAVLVSPKGASSGQGALFATGPGAVSLYVQTIGGHDELWATTLDCR